MPRETGSLPVVDTEDGEARNRGAIGLSGRLMRKVSWAPVDEDMDCTGMRGPTTGSDWARGAAWWECLRQPDGH
ncbi:hypothetical protein NDU88_005414 [Pleurodeles waltl]|uniref:Uncharacterized protein n=1 Tax=Pleurodeles waltl TaxID=8319 RepID=A0AAV7QI84_PLEWA|nr:hypothetical protein NDU88_005414 [Pleurodeles waltl]